MPLSPPAKLTVNILDVNDNTPQFKPFGITYYTERILEGATPGTTLIAVAAVDPDKGLNGLITYTLLDLMPPGYVQLEDSSAGRWEICQRWGWGTCLCLLRLREGPWLASHPPIGASRWPLCGLDQIQYGSHSSHSQMPRLEARTECPALGWDGSPLRPLEYSITLSAPQAPQLVSLRGARRPRGKCLRGGPVHPLTCEKLSHPSSKENNWMSFALSSLACHAAWPTSSFKGPHPSLRAPDPAHHPLESFHE